MSDAGTKHGPEWTDEEVLELVGEHERLVRAYLRALGCPADRVEDLAQETFLRLFTRPFRIQGAAGLRGYLRSIARNLFLNILRADASAPALTDVDQAWSDFDRGEDGSSYLDALRDCLEHLPPRGREALRLRYGSDRAREAIATQMELSLGGLKSLILRSKESLRLCIQRKLGISSIGAAETAQ